jgi:hypothetical protein
LPSSPSGALSEFLPLLLCANFLFIYFFGGESVCPGGYAGLSQGWLGEYHMMLGTHLFGLPKVSQASLEPVYGSGTALLFSQCNVVWRSFLQARGSGYRSLDPPWCFISAKCGSSISARFLIQRAHTVCFCTLVTILDPWHFGKLKRQKERVSRRKALVIIPFLGP